MPASFHIDVTKRMIFSRGTGVITDADLVSHQQRLRADPDFDMTFDQLWDLGHVVEFEVSTATLKNLSASRSFAAGAKRAIVAPTDMSYGLARMFQSMHDLAPEEVRVFRSRAEAEKWLGLQATAEPPG